MNILELQKPEEKNKCYNIAIYTNRKQKAIKTILNELNYVTFKKQWKLAKVTNKRPDKKHKAKTHVKYVTSLKIQNKQHQNDSKNNFKYDNRKDQFNYNI